jgi:cytochrome c556
MIKGEAPFDLPTAKKAFATFEDAAAKMPGLFPDNSKMGGETTASAADWHWARRSERSMSPTPDADFVGGSMAEVVRNTAQLSEADREAMATYIKALPPGGGSASGK